LIESDTEMKSLQTPNTDAVGMNKYGNEPLSPEQMVDAYKEIDRSEQLKRAQQAQNEAVAPGSFGAFDGKEQIVDPRLS